MVDILYEPWTKIVVHEFIIRPIKDVFKLLQLQTKMGNVSKPVRWCRGWVVIVEGMAPSDDVIRDQLKGTIHWSYVMASRYPNYAEIVELPGKIRVPLIDQTGKDIAESVIDWIEENFKDEISKIFPDDEIVLNEKI